MLGGTRTLANSDVQLFRTFNPGLAQSDTEIVDQFVVRHKELRVVVDSIKENIASDICQHILIIGQRGSGKSMLLARVAAELRMNPEFECVIPVRFAEESDEVIDATSFWLETLRQVAQEIETSDPQLADDTRATIQDLSGRWQDSTAEDQVQAAVLRLVERLDTKVVLMLENLQSLFENANETFGWKLREALQSSSRLVLIGTATLRFRSMDRLSMPFFEFFRVLNLAPLDWTSCQELWNKLTGNRFPSRQIRPLEILTGGNPRLLVLASSLATNDSLKLLMDELVRLIDHHTEYFKSRLEEIPTKERIVFLSMLDLWQDSTLKEIASRARMSTQSVSGLINRLSLRGLVVKEGSGRKHLYSVGERLFCFYYKLRYRNDGVAVVEHLVNFMVSFYSGAELRQLRDAIREEARDAPFIFEGLHRAKENFRFNISKDLNWRNESFDEDAPNSIANLLWFNEILENSAVGAQETPLDKRSADRTRFKDQNWENQESPAHSSTAISIVQRVSELAKQGEYEKALEELSDIFKDLSSASSESDDLIHAVVVYEMGLLSSVMGRVRDTAYSHDYFVDRFKASRIPVIRSMYVETLKSQASALAKDNRVDEAFEKLDSAISYLRDLEQRGTLDQGKFLSYEDIVRVEVQRGVILRNNDQLAESLRVLTGVLEMDRLNASQEHRSVRELAQLEIAITFRKLGRNEQSIKALEDVIESVAKNDASPWNRISIRAYSEMVETQLGESPLNALKTISAAIQDIDLRSDEQFEVELVNLLERKATIESEHVDEEAALATRQQIYDRFHETTNIEACSLVCNSLFLQGLDALTQQRLDEVKVVSSRLDILVRNLPDLRRFLRHKFDALFFRILAIVFEGDDGHKKALSTFREMGDIVERGNPLMMKSTMLLTKLLLRIGIEETDLITTLSGNKRDDMVLLPLVVALRMRLGDDIREPREIQEVAQDVYHEIYGST